MRFILMLFFTAFIAISVRIIFIKVFTVIIPFLKIWNPNLSSFPLVVIYFSTDFPNFFLKCPIGGIVAGRLSLDFIPILNLFLIVFSPKTRELFVYIRGIWRFRIKFIIITRIAIVLLKKISILTFYCFHFHFHSGVAGSSQILLISTHLQSTAVPWIWGITCFGFVSFADRLSSVVDLNLFEIRTVSIEMGAGFLSGFIMIIFLWNIFVETADCFHLSSMGDFRNVWLAITSCHILSFFFIGRKSFCCHIAIFYPKLF